MLKVLDIWKEYESQPLLRGITFSVGPGEIVCLLGPSGSGKSTLLRIIAGLEEAEKGSIHWQDQDITGLPPNLRNFGLMFQDYALFPHRNVAQNVAFGLRMQHLPEEEIDQRVKEMLVQVDMVSFAKRRVTDLSGGEQQRVALARALAPRPRLLMLDEPLGALDHNLRTQLLGELRRLLLASRVPAIYVTHDQEEAFAIASRLILLHDGRIEQQGDPEGVYRRPASSWAARFFGMGNLVPGSIHSVSPLRVKTSLGLLEAEWAGSGAPSNDAQVILLLRPNGASLTPSGTRSNEVTSRVEDVVFRGEKFEICIACEPGVTLQFSMDQPFPAGSQVSLHISAADVLCLDT